MGERLVVVSDGVVDFAEREMLKPSRAALLCELDGAFGQVDGVVVVFEFEEKASQVDEQIRVARLQVKRSAKAFDCVVAIAY